jgi:hypothetical protein
MFALKAKFTETKYSIAAEIGRFLRQLTRGVPASQVMSELATRAIASSQ